MCITFQLTLLIYMIATSYLAYVLNVYLHNTGGTYCTVTSLYITTFWMLLVNSELCKLIEVKHPFSEGAVFNLESLNSMPL